MTWKTSGVLPMSYAKKSAEKHFAPLLSDVSLCVFPPKMSRVPLRSTAECKYRGKPLSFKINLKHKQAVQENMLCTLSHKVPIMRSTAEKDTGKICVWWLTMSGCSRCSGTGHQQGHTCWESEPYSPRERTRSRCQHHTCWCGRNLLEGRRLQSRARTMCWTLSKGRETRQTLQSYSHLNNITWIIR